ncbi:hypothetical protein D3C76_1489690 [compost metagenome]
MNTRGRSFGSMPMPLSRRISSFSSGVAAKAMEISPWTAVYFRLLVKSWFRIKASHLASLWTVVGARSSRSCTFREMKVFA